MLSAAVRWLARLLGLAMVVVLILHISDEALWKVAELSDGELAEFAGLVMMIAGALLAWKWEAAGALLVLAGFGVFWAAGTEFPRGYFSLMPLAGSLHLIAWLLDHRPEKTAATAAGKKTGGKGKKRRKRVS